jgi:hypothetical protein
MQSAATKFSEELASSLVELCRAKGFDITEEQIADWASKVFTTTFRREFPGRGKGSKTIYEAGTAQQLLLFCHVHFREKKRPIADVGWRMWWHYGCEVQAKIWKQQLAEAALMFDENICLIREYDSETESFSIKENVEDRFAEFAQARTNNKIVRGIRRYLGSKIFPDFMRIAIRVAIGGFSGWEGYLSEQEIKRGDTSDDIIFEKGLGLDSARASSSNNQKAWLSGNTQNIFSVVSNNFRFPMTNVLSKYTDSEIHQARNELRVILMGCQNLKSILEHRKNKRAWGYKIIGQFFRETTPLVQALMLLGWLRIRREPEFAERIRELLPQLQKIAFIPASQPTAP